MPPGATPITTTSPATGELLVVLTSATISIGLSPAETRLGPALTGCRNRPGPSTPKPVAPLRKTAIVPTNAAS